ncbi:copper amine oxidase N-terminal domain-containing protein [Aminipila sp.]|uniref:copper amine oxidase N-terminal domain-containing protein n=1 Tax=Aminipila sp. TaxID=2060095 RepID=UPI00289822D8|nr:copper amine oxidase N-terminal domain-containing protein [Aminipila sp.]
MKKLCFVMIFALVLSSSAFAFAATAKTDNGKTTQKESTQTTQSAIQTTSGAVKTTSSAVDTTSSAVKATPSAVDTKEKTKLTVAEKKELILKKYTADELSSVKSAGDAIKKADSTVKVLDVNSIVSDTKEFKFDTPPVIKGSRTLIPVRAITEGLGAKVAYDQATKKVTITKDGTTIELTLGSNVAVVNGKQVTLDTSANTMNNRTYVPMRFIMETFNLKVSYENDGTIQVEDAAATTTTVPAIQTTTSAVQTTSAAVKTTSSAVETTSGAVKTTSSAIQK